MTHTADPWTRGLEALHRALPTEVRVRLHTDSVVPFLEVGDGEKTVIVGCHPHPVDGRLAFCAVGPVRCAALGPTDQVMQVATLILQQVRS